MFRGPKLSVFLPWVEPSSSSKTNGDKQRLLSPNDGDAGEERKANIKRAWFFATVAVLFVLANQVGHVRTASDSNSGPGSAASVSLTLSRLEGPRERGGFSVRFRLSNRGNHSIFYPVRTATNIPIGQLVSAGAKIPIVPVDWTTRRTDSAAIRLDEFIQYLGTATPSRTGRQRPESQVD